MMEPTNSDNNNIKPCLLWSCVARNDVVLAEANVPQDPQYDEYVSEAAKLLLHKKETPGWEFVTLNRRVGQLRRSTLKGMKFHVYDHKEGGDFHIWVFCCIYDPATVEACQVQSFLEKMVTITEVFRETDPQWKYGSSLVAQETFFPILLQRMEEISYLGKLAMVNDQVQNLKQIMARNIELILARGEKMDRLQEDATRLQTMGAVFKKNSKKVKRQMLWQNAKHGLLLGTAVTAGVAILVVPPLIAIF
jgi:hypothetical protein